MVTMILLQISAFVLSVAVISMKMLRVSRVILLWLEFMMGGMEQTVRLASRMTG